jgi:DNA-binding CsgD family transcriptional regulator
MADLVRRGHCAADHAGDLAPLRFGMMWGQVMALCLAGQVDEADEVADLTEAHAGDAVWAAGYPRLAHGLMASARGRVGSAARSLREAVVGFAGVDLSHWTLATCIALARALAIGGTLPEARQALGEATARLRPSTVVLEPELRLTEAWVAAADGAINEARQATQRAAALAAESGQLTLEARALHTAVRFGDRKAAARLAELATLVDGPFAAVAADHARALAADDGGALDAVAARFEGLGLVLDAADAAAQATLAHRSHGALGAERSSAARATALAEQCEGARTPALLAATQPLPLTEREREIATLVARGLSNRAIAERLVVSVRTIEGHVYRACAKLGVTDRAGLGDLLRASGAVPPPENP